MDPVKRRLVYVADENEALLNELSGTPPTRPSRTTRLLVPPSPPASSQRSSAALSPQPRPVSTHDGPPALIDRELLVSYDGFLLADGSGHFATPRSAAEAALLRDVLKTCRVYLKDFLDRQRAEASSSSSSQSPNSAASSSTYIEDGSEADDSSDDSPTPPRRRRGRQVAARPVTTSRSPSKMTVAELKTFLRERGVPAAGNKAHLVQRAYSLITREASADEEASGEGEVDAAPLEWSPQAGSELNVRPSGASVSSPASSPASSLLASPQSRTSTESRGLWGALVNVGSRFFSGTARSSLGLAGLPASNASGNSPPLKRRRSA